MIFNKTFKLIFKSFPLITCLLVNKYENYLKNEFLITLINLVHVFVFICLISLILIAVQFLKQTIIKQNNLEDLNRKYRSDLEQANSEIISTQSEIDFLNKEIDKTNILLRCCICKFKHSTHTFIPCGHFCLCQFCLNCFISFTRQNREALTCPICRRRIRNIYRTYLN